MKIIVDAMGGDNAPLEILKGCIDGRKEFGVEIMLTGDEQKIKACAKENNLDISGMDILHTTEVMEMTDTPMEIVKSKSNTSMAIGLKALADGKGDAFISAGSTGALLMGATFIVKRIKGVKRAALATVLPSTKEPFMLIDCGANVESTPHMICQFATLGDIYMRKVLSVENPRVALANIGAEETKGTPLQVESYKALQKMDNLNFTGNIEIRNIAFGDADVVVSDGFTGNVIVKMYEGVAKAKTTQIKGIFKRNAFSMLSYLGVKSGMDAFKEKMNYKQYGGAPLIGLRKPIFKAHGSSDALALKSVIRQTVAFVEGNVVEEIEEAVRALKETEQA